MQQMDKWNDERYSTEGVAWVRSSRILSRPPCLKPIECAAAMPMVTTSYTSVTVPSTTFILFSTRGGRGTRIRRKEREREREERRGEERRRES